MIDRNKHCQLGNFKFVTPEIESDLEPVTRNDVDKQVCRGSVLQFNDGTASDSERQRPLDPEQRRGDDTHDINSEASG